MQTIDSGFKDSENSIVAARLFIHPATSRQEAVIFTMPIELYARLSSDQLCIQTMLLYFLQKRAGAH